MKIKSTKFKNLKIIKSQFTEIKGDTLGKIFKNNFFTKQKFIFTCVSSSKMF